MKHRIGTEEFHVWPFDYLISAGFIDIEVDLCIFHKVSYERKLLMHYDWLYSLSFLDEDFVYLPFAMGLLFLDYEIWPDSNSYEILSEFYNLAKAVDCVQT